MEMYEYYEGGGKQKDLGNILKKVLVGVVGGLDIRNEKKKGFKIVFKIFFFVKLGEQ